MASIRPVGVLDNSVGHAAARMSSAFAVAPLSSSSAARCASSASTTCAIRSIGQSVNPAVCPLQRSVPTARALPDFGDLPTAAYVPPYPRGARPTAAAGGLPDFGDLPTAAYVPP